MSQDKSVVVVYHGDCTDGSGAALAAWKRFGEEASYHPTFHGAGNVLSDELLAGKIVYLLDFAWHRDDMIRLSSMCDIKVIDHHLTAQEEIGDLPNMVFDMTKSGAVLAWEAFFPGEPVPELLLYIQDRDLWQFRLPYSQEVSAALAAEGSFNDFRVLIKVLDDWKPDEAGVQVENAILPSGDMAMVGVRTVIPQGSKRRLIADGKAIMNAYKQMVRATLNRSALVDLGGVQAVAANSTVLMSEVAMAAAEVSPSGVGLYWLWDSARNVYQVGVRSVGDVDVGHLVLQFGGGGHKKASGFVCPTLPWVRS